MISVENFYWILVKNLLEPSGLDCLYYYPFGTQDNLSQNEFVPWRKNQSHVLFHFDQEPIWTDNFRLYDDVLDTWGRKIARILANSEHSQIKKQICQARNFSDWYFFYHGFAALDWYRDAQYMEQEYQIKKTFLSLNHVFTKREYRVALLARLIDKDVVDKGAVSFHAKFSDISAEFCNPQTQLSQPSRILIQRHMDKISSLPWMLDHVPIDGNLSARFGHQEYKLWQSSFWHLVNETVFYESKLHLTEKVFKPIVAKRPFILVAAPGNLAYLRSYGFKTFDCWIDESYDSMQDPDHRLDAITNEIARISCMSENESRELYEDMRPTLEYNKHHFFGKFREIIVSELVDNFEQCINIWNNGRVDGRELTVPHDIEAIKKILLR